MELIRSDNAFIQDKVAEITKRYSSKDAPKFMDIFNKNDSFPSHNDRHISSFFHKADPKTNPIASMPATTSQSYPSRSNNKSSKSS